MVARGEIGLLIIQIGLNNTPYMSKDAFITAVWAIVLNTIFGPVTVGFIIKYKARAIADGAWRLNMNNAGAVAMSRQATVVGADEAEDMRLKYETPANARLTTMDSTRSPSYESVTIEIAPELNSVGASGEAPRQ
jgi:hypothetical protein